MKNVKDIVDWYFSKQALPYWVVLVIDCLLILFSAYLVFWAFYRVMAMLASFWPLFRVMVIYIAICIVFFRIFKTYVGIIRYSSFIDLLRIGFAMGSAYIVSFGLHYLINSVPEPVLAHLTARVLFFIFALATILMWSERILIKFVYDSYFRSDAAMRVFIFGIRSGGIGLAKSIKGEKPARFKLVLTERHVQAVLVAPGRIERFREDTALQDQIIASGAKIFFSHDAIEWDKDTLVGPTRLKEVSVADLLPRNQIEIDLDSVAADLKGARVLITGSAGSIGSELVRQVAIFGPSEMMLIDSAETPQHDIRLMMAKEYPSVKSTTLVTSITNAERMEAVFRDFQPEFVFHAAAYKHVPMMEDNPSESIHNNVYGTKVLADLSVKYGVRKFVMISTDKAVNPTNVMGCSKRICEIYVQSLNKAEVEGKVEGHTQFVTTRFGNVLGSSGSVIEKQIKAGGPVTVTHPDIIRYFMLIPEACKLVLEAGTKGNGGEIFVFDMGKPVRIADLARRMIELSGAKDVEIKYTGLRDGEKLYEELLSEKETTKPSFNEKIRIAEVREYDFAEVEKAVNELISISHEYDDFKTVAAMKRLVPEYVSTNSAFSVLDK